MLDTISNWLVPDQNQIIYKIIKTRYAKKTINSIFIILLGFLLRSIVYSLFAFIIFFDNDYVDFFVQCGISIFLCLKNKYIQNGIEYFEDDLYKTTRYIINNYSEEKFKKWKNIGVVSTLGILFFYFYLVEINSYIIRYYILQYAFCFFFVDISENEDHVCRKYLNKFVTQREKFIITTEDDRTTPLKDFVVIDKVRISPLKAKMVKIGSEFDLVEDDEVKKILKRNNSSFEVVE